jgi:hypothetical protein
MPSDERWFHHFDPKQNESMEWHHAASPIEKEQARTTPLAGKL